MRIVEMTHIMYQIMHQLVENIYHLVKQEAHHQVGLSETPRSLIRRHYRYSSLEKFEEAFDIALHFMKKKQAVVRDSPNFQATLAPSRAHNAELYQPFSNFDN